MLQFDAEESRVVEATYTTPDVVEQRRLVLRALDLQPGERVLDIGSGPGFLTLDIAAAVGSGGAVHGIDVSESMLAIAEERARTAPAGAAPIEYRLAGVEKIPYPDASVDAVVTTQVLEYVPDIPGALAEVHRVLRPGGRVLVLDTDWDSIVWRSTDDARMQRVLAIWEGHLADARLPRTLLGSLTDAGFEPARPQVIPILNVGYDEATFSVGVLRIIKLYVSGRDGLSAEEASVWAEDLRALGPGYFFSLNRYLFSATKPG